MRIARHTSATRRDSGLRGPSAGCVVVAAALVFANAVAYSWLHISENVLGDRSMRYCGSSTGTNEKSLDAVRVRARSAGVSCRSWSSRPGVDDEKPYTSSGG